MDKARLWAVEWEQGGETLTALEPTDDELRRAAPASGRLLQRQPQPRDDGARRRAHTAGDVIAYYEELRIEGGRPFLLYMDGVLMGTPTSATSRASGASSPS